MMGKLKKLTGYRLFLPLSCLIIVLLINLITTPTFFRITINNGVLYGYIIDVINRASELVVLAGGICLRRNRYFRGRCHGSGCGCVYQGPGRR